MSVTIKDFNFGMNFGDLSSDNLAVIRTAIKDFVDSGDFDVLIEDCKARAEHLATGSAPRAHGIVIDTRPNFLLNPPHPDYKTPVQWKISKIEDGERSFTLKDCYETYAV